MPWFGGGGGLEGEIEGLLLLVRVRWALSWGRKRRFWMGRSSKFFEAIFSSRKREGCYVVLNGNAGSFFLVSVMQWDDI